MFNLYIRHDEGNYNHETVFDTMWEAKAEVNRIRENGGYWTQRRFNEPIFIPWHHISFLRVEEKRDNG